MILSFSLFVSPCPGNRFLPFVHLKAQSDVRSGRFHLGTETLARLAGIQVAVEQGLLAADECLQSMR
jgi:hypothetical protein